MEMAVEVVTPATKAPRRKAGITGLASPWGACRAEAKVGALESGGAAGAAGGRLEKSDPLVAA